MLDGDESPDRKTIRLSSLAGWRIIIGLVFLGVGVGVVGSILATAQPPATPSEVLVALMGMACFGVLWVLPALWLMGGRYDVVLDRSQGTVTTRWGLFVPFRQRTRTREDLAAIVLDPDFDNPEQFEVEIRPRGRWGIIIRLCTGALPRDEAWRLAREAASYVPLPILEAEEYRNQQARGA
jgi:hypothetical protein